MIIREPIKTNKTTVFPELMLREQEVKLSHKERNFEIGRSNYCQTVKWLPSSKRGQESNVELCCYIKNRAQKTYNNIPGRPRAQL